MAECRICGKGFNLDKTREKFEKKYNGEIEYDWNFPGGDYCYNCAVKETNANISRGEDYEFELKTGKFYYDNEDKY